MGIKENLKTLTYKIESNFFLTVIRHGLTMMIPILLIGGTACALMNLPFLNFNNPFWEMNLDPVYNILNSIYMGCFGLFSPILVITLSISYGMERNETVDKIAMYIVVALGTYGTQLRMGNSDFSIDAFGVTGSFSAIFVALFSCYLFEKLNRLAFVSLKRYTMGMESICATALSALLPMIVVVVVMIGIMQLLDICFGVHSISDLFADISCGIFDNMNNNFGSGLLYTFILHLLWVLGFHGSNILEPVAQSTFLGVSQETIFSKSFFDTYVVMGGCGTTVCVLFVLLIFYRKERMGNLAKLGAFPVIFNINEVLNFGLPIMLNPIMAVPFILTPIAMYTISYGATAIGLVPQLIQPVAWSTPIFFSGYMATGSIRGTILQIICVAVGMVIYYPFIRMHKRMQEKLAREQLKDLVRELQQDEEDNESSNFLSRADSLGLISRMLLEDLKLAIKEKKLYMLFQPQVDNEGKCLGAEALIRWKHPLYGFIYPPLVIYLAKEGGILQQLEEQIFEMSVSAIQEVKKQYDGKFKISVNITGKSLQWDIESCIENALKKYEVPTEYLWVEITEQDVISNTDTVVNKLKRLKNLGHTLLIDDFGMGHTSLIYLQSNYFGVVKLDGSLVKNILKSKTNEKIIASIIDLSRELDIKVIAEYVETEEHWNKLKELGCDWYQGYLFSKPVELEEFILFLKSRK